jgi:hypothetical protein
MTRAIFLHGLPFRPPSSELEASSPFPKYSNQAPAYIPIPQCPFPIPCSLFRCSCKHCSTNTRAYGGVQGRTNDALDTRTRVLYHDCMCILPRSPQQATPKVCLGEHPSCCQRGIAIRGAGLRNKPLGSSYPHSNFYLAPAIKPAVQPRSLFVYLSTRVLLLVPTFFPQIDVAVLFDPPFEPHLFYVAFTRNLGEDCTIRTSFKSRPYAQTWSYPAPMLRVGTARDRSGRSADPSRRSRPQRHCLAARTLTTCLPPAGD